MLRIVAKKVAQHIYHQDHGGDEVKNGSNDRVPEALAIGLFWSVGRDVLVHGCGDSDELTLSAMTMRRDYLVSRVRVDSTQRRTARSNIVWTEPQKTTA